MYRFFILLLLFACQSKDQVSPVASRPVVPTNAQVAYQQMEFVGFIHYTMNTYTDKEWGYGDEDPKWFNPTSLDVEQWVRTAKQAGMKELILTAKHHDGFCLWPSKYTKHSVAASPYKDGKGDIVREFVGACRKYGLKVGLYLSPWDRNHADYGTPEYITYYRHQLEELLVNYGEINEIWFDGANGGDGYYGGAREKRHIDRTTYYDWDKTFEMVREWQPNIHIFSAAGPDIHWIGNEHGFAGETFWSTIHSDSLVIGASNPKYLNRGDEHGNKWIIGQCDVSIRPGWFYHQSQDTLVKSVDRLLEIHNKSVGRNAVLLLNLPPNKEGRIPTKDSLILMDFRQKLDDIYATNLAQNATVTSNNIRGDDDFYAPTNVLNSDLSQYWAVDDDWQGEKVLTVDFGEEKQFDRVVLQENIALGQKVRKFELQVWKNDSWLSVFTGTTIGLKRLAQFAYVSTSKLRLLILDAHGTPAIGHVAVY